MAIATKICSKCKIDKPLNKYSKNNITADGLQYWCKDCKKNYVGQNNTDNAPEIANNKLAVTQKSTKDYEGLFSLFFQTLRKLGLRKTEKLLKETGRYENGDDMIKVLIIKNAVLKHFQITEKKLLYDTKTRDNRRDAKAVYTFLLKYYLQYQKANLVSTVRVQYSTLSDYIKYIETLDPKLKFQQTLINKIDGIKQDIEKQFKEL
jgi:hypothetical protein